MKYGLAEARRRRKKKKNLKVKRVGRRNFEGADLKLVRRRDSVVSRQWSEFPISGTRPEVQ